MNPLFIGHGSPIISVKHEVPVVPFLKRLGNEVKPKAIVIFTAHWESDVLTISSVDGTYETIYDYYGFPDEMYEMVYPAKGSPELASRIAGMYEKAGIPVQLDTKRGLDHGSWVPLKHMYPQADVPVVQISVDPFLHPSEQYKIGSVLRDLSKEEILVMGSGATVHNFRYYDRSLTTFEPEAWAAEFDQWLVDKMHEGDLESLFHYDELAPYAKVAVPRPDHFVPMFIAMGAGEDVRRAEVLHHSFQFGTLSYLCLKFY
jgi:4,5-DOPA dioxygenase extradiol